MARNLKLGISEDTGTRKWTENPRKRKRTTSTQLVGKKRKKSEPIESLIVGVDFGTTYTGVSIVSSTCGRSDIPVITNWPGDEGDHEKVPTIIAYGTENQFSGRKWGYEVTPGMKAYSWFKLKLVENEEEDEHDDPLLRQIAGQGLLRLPQGKTADDVCEDYLNCLYNYVIRPLEEKGEKRGLKNMPIKFVLTAPAGWADHAKARIKAAAERAGFGSRSGHSVRMADEPEAAALYSFGTGYGNPSILNLFKTSSNVMVVDMGGGTIDLITYRVTEWSPFKVEEACPGTSMGSFNTKPSAYGLHLTESIGAKCGSTTIDRNLFTLLERKYGSGLKDKTDQISAGSRFMKSFESIKRTFDGKKETKFNIFIAMNHQDRKGYEKALRAVVLTSAELETMFEEVLSRIFALISEQISAVEQENSDPIKTIVLCGGLAQSPYIKAKLDKFCLEELNGKTKTFVPEKPWSGIARGAALRALKPRSTIDSRRCRRSYGVRTHRKFIEGQDPEEFAFNCPVSGEKRLDNVMKWHIKKGEKMMPQKNNWIDGSVVLDNENGGLSGKLEIYYCDLDNPPEMFNSQVVKKLGDLQMDFSKVAKNREKRAQRDSRGNNKKSWHQTVRIGQRVHTDKGVVEFVAKLRNSTKVGENCFEYAPQGHSPRMEEEEDEDAREGETEWELGSEYSL